MKKNDGMDSTIKTLELHIQVKVDTARNEDEQYG